MKRLDPKDPQSLGPYSLVARLGAGGMGVVYLAAKGADRVALKVVRGSFLDDPSLRSRFLREVSTLRKINHPNVAKVLDSDTDDEIAWLAIEYVNGADLKTVVEDKGPLSEAQWVDLATGLLQALAAVHAEGVVHRDIKPANVLIEADNPKLIDFGISQISDETSLTTTGLVAGSPAWLAPEQLEGGELSSAADMFSLGSLLVYAATGQSPWGETSTMPVPVIFNKILNNQPDLSGLTDAQRALVEPLLASNPAQRPTARKALNLIGVAPKTPRGDTNPEPAKPVKKKEEVADDGRFLPLPHRGFQRKWVRDYVDARWSFAEFFVPVVVLVIVALFLPLPEAQVSAVLVSWLFLLVTTINLIVLSARVTGGLRRAFGIGSVEKGTRWYAVRRALQMRLFRRPQPEIKRGADPHPSEAPNSASSRWTIAAVPVLLIAAFFSFWSVTPELDSSLELASPAEATAPLPIVPGADINLTVGSLMPQTGSLAFLGPGSEAGVLLAIQEINEANSGVQIDLLWGDSGDFSNPTYESEILRLLDAGVHAIIGPLTSGITLDVIDQVTEESGVLLISPGAQDFALSNNNGLFFRTVPTDEQIAQTIANVMALDGRQTLGVLAQNDPYSSQWVEALTNAFGAGGGRVVANETFEFGDSDFSRQVRQIATTRPDAVVVLAFDETAEIITALRQSGIASDSFYFSDWNLRDYDSELDQGTLLGAKGVELPQNPWFFRGGFTNQLDQAWTGFGYEPLVDYRYAAESYDAVISLALAAFAAQSTDPAAIAAKMSTVSGYNGLGTKCFTFVECAGIISQGMDADYDGQSGTLAFGPNGDLTEVSIPLVEYDEDNILWLVD